MNRPAHLGDQSPELLEAKCFQAVSGSLETKHCRLEAQDVLRHVVHKDTGLDPHLHPKKSHDHPKGCGLRASPTTSSQRFVKDVLEMLNPDRANEWLSKKEISKLGELLDMSPAAARVHRAPRKRLQRPGPRSQRARVTVMLAHDPRQVLIAEESPEEVAARPQRKCPHLWRGVSLFLNTEQSANRRGQPRRRRALWPRAASCLRRNLRTLSWCRQPLQTCPTTSFTRKCSS